MIWKIWFFGQLIGFQTILKDIDILDAKYRKIIGDYTDYILSEFSDFGSYDISFYDCLLLLNDFSKSTKLLLCAFKHLLYQDKYHHAMMAVD